MRRTIGGEGARLVFVTQRGGPRQHGVGGIVDGGAATEPRVDRPQPRELAFGRSFEVAGAPDQPGVVTEDSHASTVVPTSDIASGVLADARRREGRRGRLAA